MKLSLSNVYLYDIIGDVLWARVYLYKWSSA